MNEIGMGGGRVFCMVWKNMYFYGKDSSCVLQPINHNFPELLLRLGDEREVPWRRPVIQKADAFHSEMPVSGSAWSRAFKVCNSKGQGSKGNCLSSTKKGNPSAWEIIIMVILTVLKVREKGKSLRRMGVWNSCSIPSHGLLLFKR